MPDWTTFYVAVAGASATLAGLLFVAIQINLDTLVSDPGNRWRATARSSFAIYTLLVVVSLLLLIPDLDQYSQGVVLMIAAVFGVVRAVRTWWPVLVGSWQHHSERLAQTVWYLVGPSMAYVALFIFGIKVYSGSDMNSARQSVGFIFVVLFVLVLRNSWNLIFEVAYERKQQQINNPKK